MGTLGNQVIEPVNLDEVLENDTILDVQLTPPRSFLSREEALMHAVLYDGIMTWQRWHPARHQGKWRRLFLAEEAWICSADRRWPYSFVNLCEHFGLEPDAVRQELRRRVRRSNMGCRSRYRLRDNVRQLRQIQPRR